MSTIVENHYTNSSFNASFLPNHAYPFSPAFTPLILEGTRSPSVSILAIFQLFLEDYFEPPIKKNDPDLILCQQSGPKMG
jgi:hypothetical protein